jgi:hypothetical protein
MFKQDAKANRLKKHEKMTAMAGYSTPLAKI